MAKPNPGAAVVDKVPGSDGIAEYDNLNDEIYPQETFLIHLSDSIGSVPSTFPYAQNILLQ